MTGAESLAWFASRRSIRAFSDRPVEREVLERLLSAAVSAPSSTNRQPWRFTVVTDGETKKQLVSSVRAAADAIKQVIAGSHHAADFANYSDFFYEPLETAVAIILPQVRDYPDLIAGFLESAGAEPRRFQTPAGMPAEICGTSAAVMLLLMQAKAEGLGACWMAGPMVAAREIAEIVQVPPPYRILGAIAVGHPAAPTPPGEGPARKPLDRVVHWIGEPSGARRDACPEAVPRGLPDSIEGDKR
jgi:coenzyme F420-0:L-glutamate ligase/coenzyme F420-1:gamma-L-glutamate ligase